MKKIGILGIICCLIVAAFSLFSARETIAETADMGMFLSKAFAETAADVEGWQVHNWSVIDKEYKAAEDLKLLGLNLNKTFGIQNAQEALESKGDQTSFTLRGKWQNGAAAQLVLTSMKFQDHAPQTVLVLRVEQEAKDLSDYSSAIKKVSETARFANTIPQISTCIKGLRADRMNDGELNSMVKQVLQKVKAKEIEGVRSELVTSVSGYSPLTKDYIVTNGNKMNLQVAAHFDGHLGKTRILVGSPIVTIEY
ncbi:hypothetical protein CIG75_02015 [Tumebacillus algifaecis]|uniref:TATA-box binding protein n=1 Tax=Tumebacillus algifaecis TaxID=1214604 RepID=A0A223CXF2_9BACL|nr:YwmB family TATA-box binding protein [Tumebacillus algifaecis]ASS73867.1 hypothetical protein CIG75_02015 [Tumebacillus algifaecis]